MKVLLILSALSLVLSAGFLDSVNSFVDENIASPISNATSDTEEKKATNKLDTKEKKVTEKATKTSATKPAKSKNSQTWKVGGFDAKMWNKYGIKTEDEAKRWDQNGMRLPTAKDWVKGGIKTPEKASECKALGYGTYAAKDCVKHFEQELADSKMLKCVPSKNNNEAIAKIKEPVIQPIFKIKWDDSLSTVLKKVCAIKGVTKIGQGKLNKNDPSTLKGKEAMCDSKTLLDDFLNLNKGGSTGNIHYEWKNNLKVMNLHGCDYQFYEDFFGDRSVIVNAKEVNIAGTPMNINIRMVTGNDTAAYFYLRNAKFNSVILNSRNLLIHACVDSIDLQPVNNSLWNTTSKKLIKKFKKEYGKYCREGSSSMTCRNTASEGPEDRIQLELNWSEWGGRLLVGSDSYISRMAKGKYEDLKAKNMSLSEETSVDDL